MVRSKGERRKIFSVHLLILNCSTLSNGPVSLFTSTFFMHFVIVLRLLHYFDFDFSNI